MLPADEDGHRYLRSERLVSGKDRIAIELRKVLRKLLHGGQMGTACILLRRGVRQACLRDEAAGPKASRRRLLRERRNIGSTAVKYDVLKVR